MQNRAPKSAVRDHSSAPMPLVLSNSRPRKLAACSRLWWTKSYQRCHLQRSRSLPCLTRSKRDRATLRHAPQMRSFSMLNSSLSRRRSARSTTGPCMMARTFSLASSLRSAMTPLKRCTEYTITMRSHAKPRQSLQCSSKKTLHGPPVWPRSLTS